MIAPVLTTPLAGGFLALDSSDTWVLVAFVLFIGLLIYAGVPGMLARALDERAKVIREQLNEARELREEAQGKLAAFERQHAEVEKQAEEIVARAKREAEAAAAEAKIAIEASVAQRLAAAEDQIAMAEADAVRAVRDEAVDAAVKAARSVLKTSIGASEHAPLIDQAIQETAAKAH